MLRAGQRPPCGLLRKLLRKQGYAPRLLVLNRLRSYPAARHLGALAMDRTWRNETRSAADAAPRPMR
jgi:hypothetical protein